MLNKENQQKLQEHFMGLDHPEQCRQLKLAAQNLYSASRKVERATEALRNAPARTGPRGGKHTTLQARLDNALKTFEESRQLLQLYIKWLL
jgi:hypothetical protein